MPTLVYFVSRLWGWLRSCEYLWSSILYSHKSVDVLNSGEDRCIHHNNISNDVTSTKRGINTPQGPFFKKAVSHLQIQDGRYF